MGYIAWPPGNPGQEERGAGGGRTIHSVVIGGRKERERERQQVYYIRLIWKLRVGGSGAFFFFFFESFLSGSIAGPEVRMRAAPNTSLPLWHLFPPGMPVCNCQIRPLRQVNENAII